MKKTLIVLAALLSMMSMGGAGAAFAQSAAPHAAAPHEPRTERFLARLHSTLQITPQQESQWKAFADVMCGNNEAALQMYQQDMTKRSLSSLDNVKQYVQRQKANADGAQRLLDVFAPLYDSFSPEQKAIADRSFNVNRLAIDKTTARKLLRRNRKEARRHAKTANDDDATTSDDAETAGDDAQAQ